MQICLIMVVPTIKFASWWRCDARKALLWRPMMMKGIDWKVPKTFVVAGPGPACTFAGAKEGDRQVRVPEDTPPGKQSRI